MADKNIDRMDCGECESADSKWHRQSTPNAVPAKRKKENEEDNRSRTLPGPSQTPRSGNHGHASRSLELASANETQSASCSGFGRNSSKKDQPCNENEKDIGQKPRLDTPESYAGSGLKDTLHGVVYQLKHLVLALDHAHKKGYRFRLATELDSAAKFDDLVLEYEDSEGSGMHYFAQMKHRQDENRLITANDLLADEKGGFSVLKYFNSWRKIKQHQDFAESKSKCYILCTNVGLNKSTLKDKQMKAIPVEDYNEFLKATDTEEQGSCYKLSAAENSKLHGKLESASELHQLANALADCVDNSIAIIPLRSNTFKRYYTALTREVLADIVRSKKRKFTDAFISNKGLSSIAEKFRNIFIERVRRFPSNENSSETNIWIYLATKSFTMSDSSGESTTGSQQNQLEDLPNDHIPDFLDEFILAVNQPNEQELGKTIKRVFGENSPFNLLDTDLVADSLQNMTLDWFKAKRSVHLVRANIQNFFETMKRKISSLITVGLNLHYLSELQKYDVQFKCEDKDLQEFSESSNSTENRICQIISSEQTLLTALRVYQTLEKSKKFKEDDSFIFIELKKFLLQKITRQVFLAFLSSRSQRLLAIDCGLDSNGQDMEKLKENLDDIISKLAKAQITGKRIILILPEKDDRVIWMKRVDPISEAKVHVSIDNIETATQGKLLRKKVIRFQERARKISFMDLFGIDNFDDVAKEQLGDYRRIIGPKTLVRLIRGEELRFGKKSEGLREVAKYYIPRTIDLHRVVIQNRILIDPQIIDTFAISGIVAEALEELLTSEERLNENSDRTTPNHRAKYIILEEGRERERFDSLCQENSNSNIHWLQREHGKFIWMRSFRNSTSVLGYRDKTRCDNDDNDGRGVIQLSEVQLAQYDEQRGIVILSDTAGMGKSTVLTRVAEKIRENEPCQLVIKIDLTSRSTVLASEKNKRSFNSNDVNGAVDFLVDKLIPNLTPEDVSWYKTIIKVQRKVAILFDGFDEISLLYKETVIDLLQVLAILEVKQLFVSTRPHTSRVLEEKFGVPSYMLRPFSAPNQLDFLTKFWNMRSVTPNSVSSSSENMNRLQEHARNVIDLLAKSIDPSMKEFTGVPLQTRMVAEIFPFESSSIPKSITITKMYEQFVDKKCEFYCIEEKQADPNIQANKPTEYERYPFIRMHENVALDLLFDETVVKLLSSPGDFFDDIWNNMVKDQERTRIVTLQKDGLITLRSDGQFRFIHRTFAEYFAAEFFSKMFLNGQCNRAVQEFCVGKLFVQPEYRVIRAFLNCLLVKQNEPSGGKSWEIHMSKRRDPEGGTAYHVAASEGHVEIVKFLWNNIRGDPRACIDDRTEEGETPLQCAAAFGHLEVVKFLKEQGADIHVPPSWYAKRNTPLLRAAKSGHLKIVKYLAESGADINVQTKKGKTPLLRAVASGNLDLVKLLTERGAKIDVQNTYGNTPLMRAARSGNLEMVKYLAESGADIRIKNEYGNTPLMLAAWCGHLEVVKYLIAEREADINAQTTFGITSLHYAAESGHLDMVKYLAQTGANINARTKDGETPLLRAAESGHPEVVKYLTDREADIHAQTRREV